MRPPRSMAAMGTVSVVLAAVLSACAQPSRTGRVPTGFDRRVEVKLQAVELLASGIRTAHFGVANHSSEGLRDVLIDLQIFDTQGSSHETVTAHCYNLPANRLSEVEVPLPPDGEGFRIVRTMVE